MPGARQPLPVMPTDLVPPAALHETLRIATPPRLEVVMRHIRHITGALPLTEQGQRGGVDSIFSTFACTCSSCSHFVPPLHSLLRLDGSSIEEVVVCVLFHRTCG